MELNGIKNRALVFINEPISLQNCSDILILHCTVTDHPETVGIYLYQCSNVIILNCNITNVQSGVYADHCTNSITVSNCTFKNIQGPKPRGQAVQFNNFNGYGGVIADNLILNQPLRSSAEDAISLYQSNGTKDSPIMVTGNRIRGGGPSLSGGGIMLGDGGGSWQIAQGNKLVDPGQYGVAIAGGDNISLIDNLIYSSKKAWSNVGLYVMNYSPIGKHTISGNRVNFTNSKGVLNNSWFGYGDAGGVLYDSLLGTALVGWV